MKLRSRKFYPCTDLQATRDSLPRRLPRLAEDLVRLGNTLYPDIITSPSIAPFTLVQSTTDAPCWPRESLSSRCGGVRTAEDLLHTRKHR